MTVFFFYLILNSLFCVVLTYVHETGHYIMGRYIGIPKDKLNIEMKKFPPHVAIKKEGEFISPVRYEQYIEAYFEYDPEGYYSYRFINAGFASEFVFIVILFLIFNLVLEIPVLSISLILTSLVVYIVYLVISIVMTVKTKNPWGDFGAMWRISKPLSFCIITLFIIMKSILLIYSISNV
ncbi:hypothetical protein LGQ02_15800 [Bacillus shivajii]|uniref:hypothetical protein n=1 Tax=Bacillus shivajii TaxID=1983719 RepID=UPI001CFA04EB|nr:hypothetical protein [Bacillus shivajii]UCZ52294.1 hypothetical protein LGQ02_15800 [Bacillus shivajii]